MENLEILKNDTFGEINLLNNNSLIPITVIAKDYGMSGIQMNKILNSLKVQYKISDKWVLYQEYAPYGYTHSKTIYTPTGKSIIVTYWTEKGRAFIYRLLKETLNMVPLVEK